MKIHLKPNATQERRNLTLQRIPLAWKDEADKLVYNMLKNAVIKHMHQPGMFYAMAQFVMKPNRKFHFMTDYCDLNTAIICPYHTFHSAIISKATPSTLRKADMVSVYWHIPLERHLSYLSLGFLALGMSSVEGSGTGQEGCHVDPHHHPPVLPALRGDSVPKEDCSWTHHLLCGFPGGCNLWPNCHQP